MEKEYFLLEDKKKEIESKFLIKNGWLKIYEEGSKDFDDSATMWVDVIAFAKAVTP